MSGGDAGTAAKPGSARQVTYRGGVFQPTASAVVGAMSLVVLVTVWQLASSTGLMHPLIMPSPWEVGAALWRLTASGALWEHVSASLFRLVGGLAIGTTLGAMLGFAMGLASVARSVGLAIVSALFPIPKIALLPLFIIWFGIGEGSKLATIAIGTFFPMAIATYGGVDGVDRTLVRMGKSFGLPAHAIVAKIILPGALPAMLSGLRIAASIGIILLVSAEMIGANRGIGAFVLMAGNLMAIDQLMAGVVVLSLMGLTVAGLIGLMERRLLGWR